MNGLDALAASHRDRRDPGQLPKHDGDRAFVREVLASRRQDGMPWASFLARIEATVLELRARRTSIMTSTQIQQDNIALIRRGFEAFGAGDMATLTELFTPDVRWHGAPAGILPGEIDGRDALFAMFGQLQRETNNTFHSVPTSYAANDEGVFVRAVASGTRTGRTLESDEIILFSIANGKVHDVRLYVADHEKNVAFWS